MIPPLLTTRLHRPSLRAHHVSRPRLVERLRAAADPRLAVVVGPAGYGKTTLLAEWLSELAAAQPAPCLAWVSLDAGDDDPIRFWSTLIASLRLGCGQPDLGAEALGLLRTPGPRPLEAVVTLLLNELTTLPAPLWLALDDYHLIQAPAIHGSLARLIEHLPAAVHVAIATRADPPLGLARLRARGALCEIGPQDLRFTPDEAAVFLTNWLGSVSAEAVERLETRTEGWAAGLQLAALALRECPDREAFLREFAGSQRHIVAYLIEEVLQRQPAVIQDFLLRTSVLHGFSADVCAALLPPDGPSAASLLDQLDHAQLFLVPLDEQRRWYRYHQLFAEALQDRLDREHPGLSAELHRRAGDWFDAAGHAEPAIAHARAAGDHHRAIQRIRAQARPLMIRGELATLLGWIESLPVEARNAEPWLMIEQAMALLFAGQLDLAEAIGAQAEALATQSSDVELNHLRGVLAALRAYAADARGAFAQSLAHAAQADTLLRPDDYLARGILPFVRGRAYLVRGDLTAAEAAFAEMVATAGRAGNIWTLAVAVGQAAHTARLRGRLTSAAEAYASALATADARGERAFAPAALLESGLAGILYERNDIAAARRLLDGAVGRLRAWSNPASLAACLQQTARVCLALGDLVGAEQALAEAEAIVQRTAVAPMTRAALIAERVRLWLARGEQGVAARWAATLPASNESPSPADDVIAAAVARVDLVLGRPAQAAEALEPLVTRAEATGRIGQAIEFLALRAAAVGAAGRRAEARQTLLRGLRLAEPEGYLRVFLDEGEPLQRSLEDLLNRDDIGELRSYAARLQSTGAPPPRPALATPAPPTTPSAPLLEPLSARELEVLRLVRDGLSNREIAERLVVTLATAKKHIENLHGKLGVHSRTQALARARELGLI